MKKFIANFPSQAGERIAKITGTRVRRNLNTGEDTREVEVEVIGLQSEGEGNWTEYYTESYAENLGLVKF